MSRIQPAILHTNQNLYIGRLVLAYGIILQTLKMKQYVDRCRRRHMVLYLKLSK